MQDTFSFPLLSVRLRHERHVVQARQRARELAELLGFEHQEQIRLATAASELARNAFRYAEGGSVEFAVRDGAPQVFVICVTDSGKGIGNLNEILDGRYVSKTGLGMGLIGTRRLMDHFHIATSAGGTQAEFGKPLPGTAARVTAAAVKTISNRLAGGSSADPFDEVERQNQELLTTLATLKEKQDMLTELNRELEETNRGVVALYAELEEHADDLRRVSDLKTSFLSNLSHEFRTPLNSISSLSRLLLGRSDGELSAEQEKQVSYIQQSAAELSELVNDLLDLAKVEAGKIDVKPKHFEVDDFFAGLRGMLKPLLGGNHLELLFDAAPEMPVLYTDEGKLSQILRNLISNALKFTPKGYIRVTAEHDAGGWTIFRVEDTGIGLLPEDQERIFEEFVQVEGEIQSQVKGTGLGLPLSRRLAQLLGGSLTVESEMGLGSTFTVRIPFQLSVSETETLSRVAKGEANGPKVLFIEDNRETRFIYQSSLKDSRYRSTFVANLPEARAAIKKETPALVVLDRNLEQKDCLYFIEELRAGGYAGQVLVLSLVDDAEAALKAGATAFLAKPVAAPTLLNSIAELVESELARTILLVDDDEVVRYLVGAALTKGGYRVMEAHGGREALKLMEGQLPDAIMLDLSMPDMSGFEVFREIRRGERTKAVPVIVHSSLDVAKQESGLVVDANTVLYTKQSFSAKDGAQGLLQMLEDTLSQKRETVGVAH